MNPTDLTAMDLALKDLTLHELNARAALPETYEADDIACLAASIATLGLLNRGCHRSTPSASNVSPDPASLPRSLLAELHQALPT